MMLQGHYNEIRERAEANLTGPEDVDALIDHVDELEDKLTDCWMLLDPLARSGNKDAEALLRKQKVVGWK